MGGMAEILYAGRTIALPDTVDVDELATLLRDAYAKGGHSWMSFDLPGDQQRHVRLLFGPGIPVGFISDQKEREDAGVFNHPTSESGQASGG